MLCRLPVKDFIVRQADHSLRGILAGVHRKGLIAGQIPPGRHILGESQPRHIGQQRRYGVLELGDPAAHGGFRLQLLVFLQQNGKLPAGFRLRVLRLFRAIHAYAEHDHLSVFFSCERGSQHDGDGFSVKEKAVTVDKEPVLPHLTQHVFLRENAQMPLHILRRDRLRRVQPDVGKEILSLPVQTEALKFI